ncbi:unnamed protein product [Dicrocoelium dendriticum]|nr:unnamed protein product [Dicrocoelium dendriticum]
MQLMELIEAPTQGESTKSNGAFSSTAIVPKPNATSELAFCRPRQEVLDNFERFLALDTVPSNASNGTDAHHNAHANGIRGYRKVFATEYDPEEDIMLNSELSLDLGPIENHNGAPSTEAFVWPGQVHSVRTEPHGYENHNITSTEVMDCTVDEDGSKPDFIKRNVEVSIQWS